MYYQVLFYVNTSEDGHDNITCTFLIFCNIDFQSILLTCAIYILFKAADLQNILKNH